MSDTLMRQQAADKSKNRRFGLALGLAMILYISAVIVFIIVY